MLNSSNIPLWTAITAIAGLGQVLVLIVSAYFVWRYLQETTLLRRAAQRQVEATFRPSVVVTHKGSMDSEPQIENIGSGPAMQVTWRLKNSEWAGTFPYLLPKQPQSLPLTGVKPLYEAAGNNPQSLIECTYRSVSGLVYRSHNSYDINKYHFTTTFADGES